MVKLKGKIRKVGNSYGILLQKAFFDQNILHEGQEAIVVVDTQNLIYPLWYSNTHIQKYSLASA
jgi:antitoxin component of MazEF toxin-antitoxin module